MDLSIIIVNWNTREYLGRCLQSIRSHPFSGTSEVIVVDNASSDSSAQMVREQFSEAVLIANTQNACYAEGNNQGIRIATGKYILLLNPDTEMKPGTLDALMDFAKSHPDTGAVGCRLVGSDGMVQSSCRSFPYPIGVFFEYARLSRVFPKSRLFGSYRMTYFDYQHEAEVDQPMASCLLIPKAVFDRVGLFDPEFPIFFNEVDWCYRAKQQGWKVYFTPASEVVHLGGASTRQVKPAMVVESHKSLARFYRKHFKSRIFAPAYCIIMGAISANSFLASRLRPSGHKPAN